MARLTILELNDIGGGGDGGESECGVRENIVRRL